MTNICTDSQAFGVLVSQVMVVLGNFAPVVEGCFDISYKGNASIFRVTATFT
jgi:hypothetical protein